FNSGDRADNPIVPMEEARRHREIEAKWKTELDAARESVAEFKKKHAGLARKIAIDRLKISDAEKAILKENPDSEAGRKLAAKFVEELKVPEKDDRELLSKKDRDEWAACAATVKAIEARKPKPLPAAFGFKDFGPQPRETFLLARGDFHARS